MSFIFYQFFLKYILCNYISDYQMFIYRFDSFKKINHKKQKLARTL
jgi:hypothetical protein